MLSHSGRERSPFRLQPIIVRLLLFHAAREDSLGIRTAGGSDSLAALFLAGAITDTLALGPMLVPQLGQLLWGFTDLSGPYKFAMGYAASLMLAWTILLVWAYRDPPPRRFIAALTVLVIYGLIAAEIMAVRSGHLEAWRMIPTWVLQVCLLALFAGSYHYPWVQRHLAVCARHARRGESASPSR